jgi:rhamnopyranosyl-N-acetylglucosaminyl-diphospho-decaprenol beta-1,3/1,4-galactofuranosyltransferase
MVYAIVVTHNRKELLRECLAALRAQTRAPEGVLVVDNASTDGTEEMVRAEVSDVELLRLDTNEGSAGGFHEGMKRAHADGAEWMWLMDDDTIPEPDALAELLGALPRLAPEVPSMLVSKTLWRDGRVHPMNTPWPHRKSPARMIEGASRGLMPLRSATWVSLLVHRGAVDRHGLPLKHFFIWSDDIDYTGRVLFREPGYLVPTSVVVHKTESPYTAMAAAPDRFYFHVRNTLYIIRGPGRRPREKLIFVWLLFATVLEYLGRKPTVASGRAILRGLRDGLRPLDARSADGPTRPRPG